MKLRVNKEEYSCMSHMERAEYKANRAIGFLKTYTQIAIIGMVLAYALFIAILIRYIP